MHRTCILPVSQSAISNVRGTRKCIIQCTKSHEKKYPNVPMYRARVRKSNILSSQHLNTRKTDIAMIIPIYTVHRAKNTLVLPPISSRIPLCTISSPNHDLARALNHALNQQLCQHLASPPFCHEATPVQILCLRLMRSFGVFFVQALHQVREDSVVS